MGGLTWGDLDVDLVLRKSTTKTGNEVWHDLKACPLALDLLDRVPEEQRIGPMIIDESAGRPYATSAYGREWRKVARAAGNPDGLRNMDSRAGGVSEGDEAGAPVELLQAQTGHTQLKTLERYRRGEKLDKSRRVVELRSAYREAKNGT